MGGSSVLDDSLSSLSYRHRGRAPTPLGLLPVIAAPVVTTRTSRTNLPSTVCHLADNSRQKSLLQVTQTSHDTDRCQLVCATCSRLFVLSCSEQIIYNSCQLADFLNSYSQYPTHPLHYMLPLRKVSTPTYPFSSPKCKKTRYGRDLIPYCTASKY